MTQTANKMIQYDMNDYEEIMNAGFICNLTQDTLDIISKLSEQVGAPTYIKTPIFLKKESRVAGLGMGLGSAISAMAGSGNGNGISGFKKGKIGHPRLRMKTGKRFVNFRRRQNILVKVYKRTWKIFADT